MSKVVFVLSCVSFLFSCQLFRIKKVDKIQKQNYCFQEMDSIQYLRFYGPNPKFGTSDDWGMITENGVRINGDCIHRADSIILCNKRYGIGKKCDTIPRPGYQARLNKTNK
jgi:hypothetical protein